MPSRPKFMEGSSYLLMSLLTMIKAPISNLKHNMLLIEASRAKEFLTIVSKEETTVTTTCTATCLNSHLQVFHSLNLI